MAEIAIKARMGKLAIPADVASWLPGEIERHRFRELPLLVAHSLHISTLPHVHGDPFDRLLIAQAVHEDLVVLTSDATFDSYPVTVVW